MIKFGNPIHGRGPKKNQKIWKLSWDSLFLIDLWYVRLSMYFSNNINCAHFNYLNMSHAMWYTILYSHMIWLPSMWTYFFKLTHSEKITHIQCVHNHRYLLINDMFSFSWGFFMGLVQTSAWSIQHIRAYIHACIVVRKMGWNDNYLQL